MIKFVILLLVLVALSWVSYHLWLRSHNLHLDVVEER